MRPRSPLATLLAAAALAPTIASLAAGCQLLGIVDDVPCSEPEHCPEGEACVAGFCAPPAVAEGEGEGAPPFFAIHPARPGELDDTIGGVPADAVVTDCAGCVPTTTPTGAPAVIPPADAEEAASVPLGASFILEAIIDFPLASSPALRLLDLEAQSGATLFAVDVLEDVDFATGSRFLLVEAYGARTVVYVGDVGNNDPRGWMHLLCGYSGAQTSTEPVDVLACFLNGRRFDGDPDLTFRFALGEAVAPTSLDVATRFAAVRVWPAAALDGLAEEPFARQSALALHARQRLARYTGVVAVDGAAPFTGQPSELTRALVGAGSLFTVGGWVMPGWPRVTATAGGGASILLEGSRRNLLDGRARAGDLSAALGCFIGDGPTGDVDAVVCFTAPNQPAVFVGAPGAAGDVVLSWFITPTGGARIGGCHATDGALDIDSDPSCEIVDGANGWLRVVQPGVAANSASDIAVEIDADDTSIAYLQVERAARPSSPMAPGSGAEAETLMYPVGGGSLAAMFIDVVADVDGAGLPAGALSIFKLFDDQNSVATVSLDVVRDSARVAENRGATTNEAATDEWPRHVFIATGPGAGCRTDAADAECVALADITDPPFTPSWLVVGGDSQAGNPDDGPRAVSLASFVITGGESAPQPPPADTVLPMHEMGPSQIVDDADGLTGLVSFNLADFEALGWTIGGGAPPKSAVAPGMPVATEAFIPGGEPFTRDTSLMPDGDQFVVYEALFELRDASLSSEQRIFSNVNAADPDVIIDSITVRSDPAVGDLVIDVTRAGTEWRLRPAGGASSFGRGWTYLACAFTPGSSVGATCIVNLALLESPDEAVVMPGPVDSGGALAIGGSVGVDLSAGAIAFVNIHTTAPIGSAEDAGSLLFFRASRFFGLRAPGAVEAAGAFILPAFTRPSSATIAQRQKSEDHFTLLDVSAHWPRLSFVDESADGFLSEAPSTNLLVNTDFSAGWVPTAGVVSAVGIEGPRPGSEMRVLPADQSIGQALFLPGEGVFTASVTAHFEAPASTLVINLGGVFTTVGLERPPCEAPCEQLAVGGGWIRYAVTTSSAPGVLTFSAEDDAVTIAAPQLEERAFATSFIPSGAAAGVRTAESMVLFSPRAPSQVGELRFVASFTRSAVPQFLLGAVTADGLRPAVTAQDARVQFPDTPALDPFVDTRGAIDVSGGVAGPLRGVAFSASWDVELSAVEARTSAGDVAVTRLVAHRPLPQDAQLFLIGSGSAAELGEPACDQCATSSVTSDLVLVSRPP